MTLMLGKLTNNGVNMSKNRLKKALNTKARVSVLTNFSDICISFNITKNMEKMSQTFVFVSIFYRTVV